MRQRTPAPIAPLAAIDMGSNSFRLEIGQVLQGRYRRLEYLKEPVRLGTGLDGERRLSEAAMRLGLDCLQRFALRLGGFQSVQVRAVATQTLREARNRDEFLSRAESALGFPIEVISGREEARLIYAGVAHLQPSTTPRLVIDIGGRSTEMILGHGRVPVAAESFKVGSASLSARWFAQGRYTAEAFRGAQVAAGAELEEALQLFAPVYWREALGASGTAGAVSQILRAAGITDGRITPSALRWCIEQCLAAGDAQHLQLPTLRDDRKPIIGGGLSLLYTLVTHFGIDELKPAQGALRQGVIIDTHERHAARRGPGAGLGAGSGSRAGAGAGAGFGAGAIGGAIGGAVGGAIGGAVGGDMRDVTVRELQVRFDVDVNQALRVRALALALAQSAWPEIERDAVRELGWAADLHEMGLMVSHHDHHRHGAYLMRQVDAPGFSQTQQGRLGDLLLAQRGGLRKLGNALARPGFAWQAMALRLAAILCHARAGVDDPAVPDRPLLYSDGAVARLSYPSKWASTNLRTLHLLREEVQAWTRQPVLRLELPD